MVLLSKRRPELLQLSAEEGSPAGAFLTMSPTTAFKPRRPSGSLSFPNSPSAASPVSPVNKAKLASSSQLSGIGPVEDSVPSLKATPPSLRPPASDQPAAGKLRARRFVSQSELVGSRGCAEISSTPSAAQKKECFLHAECSWTGESEEVVEHLLQAHKLSIKENESRSISTEVAFLVDGPARSNSFVIRFKNRHFLWLVQRSEKQV